MNVDIDNIASKKQPFWRPICEVIKNSYFEEAKLFPTKHFNQFRNIPNETQNIPNEIKAAFKNGYGTGVVCTIGSFPPKGVIQ